VTIDDAIEAVKLILASYPSQRQRMSAKDIHGMYAAYAAGLTDLPFDIVRLGITKLVKTSKWMPTIAEIRGAAVTARDGRAREGAEGWSDALAAVGRYGVNRTPGKDFEFVDKLVDRVVHAIGWRELCLSEFQIADRARFIELYEQLAEHDAIDRVSGMLPSSAPSRALPGGTRAIQEPERILEPAVKLELVPASDDGPHDETMGDMIKRLVAKVVEKP
jgi:hypothetical protein